VAKSIAKDARPKVSQINKTMLEEAKAAGQLGEIRGVTNLEGRRARAQVGSARGRLTQATNRLGALEERLQAGPVEVAPGAYKPALLSGGRLKDYVTDKLEGHATALELADAGVDLKATPEALQASGHLLFHEAIQKHIDNPGVVDALKAIQDDVATTMDQLHAKGIQPEYLAGGTEESVNQSGISPPSRITDVKTRAERQKLTGDLPKSFNRLTELNVRELARSVQNKTNLTLAETYGKTAREVLGDALDKLDPTDPLAIDLKSAAGHTGHDLAMEMDRHGYTQLPPRPGESPTMPTADTKFVPKPIAEAYDRIVKSGNPKGALKVYDQATRMWKHSVLPLSPMWQVGNVVGNTMLAMVGAGMGVADIAKFGPQALKNLRAELETGTPHYDPNLYGAGGAHEMLGRDNGTARLTIKGREIRPVLAGYKANEFVDNIGRSMVYDFARSKGMDHAASVEYALKAMGDFGNMNPLERNVVKRVIPFYAWQRHITKLAFSLPLEHPMRVAWTMHLSQIHNDPMTAKTASQKGLPDWMDGYIPVGGKWLSSGGMNPFTMATNLPVFSPREELKSVNPLIQFGAFAGADINLRKGRMNTRPAGTGPMDSTGKRILGPAGLSADANWLIGQSPIGRGLQALAPNQFMPGRVGSGLGDNVARYDTGDPIVNKRGKTLPTEGSRFEQVIKNFAPWPITLSAKRLQDQAAAAKKKQEAFKRAQANRQRKAKVHG
jgi:hypothetical protein